MRISTPNAAAGSGPGDEETVERLAPGEIVAERYRVVSFLGEGGMGAVYRVEHQHMRKAFALKVMHRSLLDRPEIVARFEREARAAGSIGHPNVAAATDFGRLPDGSFFLILEFVRGRSLRDEVAAGALEPDRATRIVRGIVAGVGAAHAKGIVHRDLKPENVMLVDHDGDRDFVKVLDFGIAKVEPLASAGGGGVAAPLTQMGAVIGTPEYMSPEQAMGNPVDARSDLYSIGVIYYELLSGQCPFEGDGIRLLRQHVLGEVPPLPTDVAKLDPRIPRIVDKLLAKQPGERFATATELGIALSEAAAPPRFVASPTPRPLSVRERVHGALKTSAAAPRAVRVGVLAGLVAVAAIIAMGIALHRAGRADASAGVAEPAPAAEPPPATVRVVPSAVVYPPSPPTLALPRAPAPTESASAPPPPQRSGPFGPAAGSAPPAHRKTGPGGIYIPPPRDWFK